MTYRVYKGNKLVQTLKHCSWVHFKLMRRLIADQTIKGFLIFPLQRDAKEV